MIIENNTLEILKNFSEINQSILIKEGSVLYTINEQRNVLAKAIVAEEFPITFGIYDLHKFLGVLSLFNQPALSFKEKSLTIQSAVDDNNFKTSDQTAEYQFADPSMIQKPPDKQIKMPDTGITFTLQEKFYNAILRAASVMSLPEIAIEAANNQLSLKAIDSKQSIDSYSVVVGECSDTLKSIFKIENFKMMKGSYEVTLTSGLGHFKNLHKNLEYWIASESTSS